MDEQPEVETTTDEPDRRSSANRAKEEAAKQSIDPATWRKGGVGVDP